MTLIGARGEIAASRQCIVDWYCCCCFSLLSSFAFSRHFNFCGYRLLLIRIQAAHIVPYCIGEELPGYLFGSDQGLRLYRPDNCLMMHEYIEQAFDNGNITIFPVDTGTRPVLRWKTLFVNQDARNQRQDYWRARRKGDYLPDRPETGFSIPLLPLCGILAPCQLQDVISANQCSLP